MSQPTIITLSIISSTKMNVHQLQPSTPIIQNNLVASAIDSPNQISKSDFVSNKATKSTLSIPNFNHVGIVLEKKPRISLDEKETKRLAYQKQCSAKYSNKVKEYKKIGSLFTEKDKIKRLLILCYPELSNFDQNNLDHRIANFITSLGL